MPVVYVVGDVAGVRESPVYAILEMSKKIDAIQLPRATGSNSTPRRYPRATAGSP